MMKPEGSVFMVHLVWMIGAMIGAWGLLAVFTPEKMRSFVRFMAKEKRYYLAAIFRFIIAVIFLILARDVQHTRIILFLGLLFLAGGILVLVIPGPRIKGMLDWWIAKPLWVYRLWGVVAAMFGVLIIYAGWPAA
jgi:hypothetical protein